MKGVYFDLQFDQYCQKLSGLCPSEVAAKDFKLYCLFQLLVSQLEIKASLENTSHCIPVSPCALFI